ncbi:MAG: hypothetical protein K2X47_04540 [Bdellovibrionales bacterium]|nr:hypothetical protein [Bdellovibrionales bacterium]
MKTLLLALFIGLISSSGYAIPSYAPPEGGTAPSCSNEGAYRICCVWTAAGNYTCSRYDNPSNFQESDRVNFAAASQGARVGVSSQFDARFPAAAIINGERAGRNWERGGGWNDGTPNAFVDGIEILFARPKSINEINIYTLQDNYLFPVEPTPSLQFSLYGLTDGIVYGVSNGRLIELGRFSKNRNVQIRIQFAYVELSSIRVVITGALNAFSRVTEIEALGKP